MLGMSHPGTIFSASEEDRIEKLTQLIPIPKHERRRIIVLRETQLVDSDPEDIDLERIVMLTRRVFKTAVVAIAFVDVDRVFVKAKVGFDESEFPRELCLCAYTVSDYEGDVFQIPDACAVERFAHFPAVALGIRFYAGVPLVCEGLRIGSLCVADGTPRAGLTELEAAKLTGIASLLSTLIGGRHKRLLKKQDAVAAMVAGVTHRLRAPLRAVNERAIAVRARIQACKEASTPPARLTEGAMLHCTLAGLLQDAQALQDEVERTLRSASNAFAHLGKSSIPGEPSSCPYNAYLPWERVWASLRAAATKRFDDAQLRWDVDELLRGEELRVGVQGLAMALDVALTLQRHLLGSERVHVECSLSSLQSLKAEDVRAGKLAVVVRGSASQPCSSVAAYSTEERQAICRSAETLCRTFLDNSDGFVEAGANGIVRMWVPCLCRTARCDGGVSEYVAEDASPVVCGVGDEDVLSLGGGSSSVDSAAFAPLKCLTLDSLDAPEIKPWEPLGAPIGVCDCIREGDFFTEFLRPIWYNSRPLE